MDFIEAHKAGLARSLKHFTGRDLRERGCVRTANRRCWRTATSTRRPLSTFPTVSRFPRVAPGKPLLKNSAPPFQRRNVSVMWCPANNHCLRRQI